MSSSKLVNYTKLSPNCNSPRNHKIDKITIHHMAGNLTVEQCGALFSQSSRQASSNYGVGTDGRIGLYVSESDRSWCSSNAENDNRAVTIEVANDKPSDADKWHVSDKAIAALIELCADICKRNGIKKLNFTGDKSGNVTLHKWFAATACPGPYLESKIPFIVEQVNKKLSGKSETKVLDMSGFKKGDKGDGVLALKCLLKLSGVKGLDDTGGFGGGTQNAVNALLKKWGYKENGVAGGKFIAKLYKSIK